MNHCRYCLNHLNKYPHLCYVNHFILEMFSPTYLIYWNFEISQYHNSTNFIFSSSNSDEVISPSGTENSFLMSWNKKEMNWCRFFFFNDFIERVVGFRFGSYREGSSAVGDPSNCSILPDAMTKVAKVSTVLYLIQ